MNARKRALLKYGLYSALALVCAALAALGSFKVSPLLAGPVHRVFLMLVAIAMALQALALSRRKKQDCFIVRREELIGGSLILLIGAALLLVLALAGCSPDRTELAAHGQTINFTAANEQFRGASFALGSLEALKRSCCRDDAKDKADRLPLAALLGFRSLERSPAAQQPRQRCAPGGTKQALL